MRIIKIIDNVGPQGQNMQCICTKLLRILGRNIFASTKLPNIFLLLKHSVSFHFKIPCAKEESFRAFPSVSSQDKILFGRGAFSTAWLVSNPPYWQLIANESLIWVTLFGQEISRIFWISWTIEMSWAPLKDELAAHPSKTIGLALKFWIFGAPAEIEHPYMPP